MFIYKLRGQVYEIKESQKYKGYLAERTQLQAYAAHHSEKTVPAEVYGRFFQKEDAVEVAKIIEAALEAWFVGKGMPMFTENQLAQLDRKYFNVILADGLDITVQSRNTGYWWYLHCTGCEGENAVIMFHRHCGNHRYHQHGRARSLRQAVKRIQGHDAYQMNGRRPVRR